MDQSVQQAIVGDADFWISWVPAAPFRAWLDYLAAATGYAPEAIAVAAGMTTGTGRALRQRAYRLRSSDAKRLMSMDIQKLIWDGSRMTEARLGHQALAVLGALCPNTAQLSLALGVSAGVAQGLIDGWLPMCRRSVIWHCVALSQRIIHDRAVIEPDDFDEELTA